MAHSRNRVLGILFVALLAPAGNAQQMRAFQEIRSPFSFSSKDSLPLSLQVPMDPSEMNEITDSLVKAWDSRQLKDKLSEQFQQGSRLQEALQLKVPRDARLQIEAIRNVYTLDQKIEENNGVKERVSTVTATLSTRILSNDPTRGFTAIPGTTEVVLRVYEELD
jgi:hypothetical protein